MKIIDLYIAKTLLYYSAVVLFLLCGLMLFATFIAELGDIGNENYTALKAAEYTLLTLPRMVYDMFPIGLFIGTLIGLGSMATNNELTIMQSAGISIFRLFLSLVFVALIMMLTVFVIGEFVVPKAEALGQKIRSQAISPKGLYQSKGNFWIRDKNSFIKIGSIPSITELGQISIYRLNENQQIRDIINSKKAYYRHGEWQLEDINILHLNSEAISRTHLEVMPWKSPFNPKLLTTLATKPAALTLLSLNRYIHFLNENELDSKPYKIAFWKKISTPFSTIIMMILALPCVLGLLRSSNLGVRIMIGSLLGIGFFLLNNLSSKLSLVYNLSPSVSAFVPSAVFLLLALLLLRRVH